jgi:exopolysaccharide production protein ExoZ
MSSKSSRWESLHFLRAAASLVVVAHHVPQFLATRVPYAVDQFDAGAVGVDIFFVISGFVMYCATARRPPPWQDFLAKRAIRVIPMYWLVTIAVTAAVWCVPSAFAQFRVPGDAFVKSLLFVPVYDPQGDIRPVIAVGWTLHFELMFYALVSLALPFSGRRASLVAAAIVFASSAACALLGMPQAYSPWQLLGPIVMEFALGVALAHMLHSTRLLSRPVALRIAASCAALALAAYLIMQPTIRGGVTMERFRYWGIGSLAIVGALALLEPELVRIQRMHRVYSTLGDTSYALYIIHGSILPITWKLMPETLRANPVAAWLTLLTVPVLVSLPAHYWLEANLTRYITKLRSDLRRVAAPSSATSVEQYGD